MKTAAQRAKVKLSPGAASCRAKFLRFFPNGFQDDKYFAWERGYKWAAHERWGELLDRTEFRRLLRHGEHAEIGARALRSLSRTNLLFSFENMALRDALASPNGSSPFAEGLYRFLHGSSGMGRRFDEWCSVVASLPKKRSRVFTHPVATVFGFVAQPDTHIFLKPIVSKAAALKYGFDLRYRSQPSWETYASLLQFAEVLKRDLRDLEPRDMMDIQSFIWVQGSNEYEES